MRNCELFIDALQKIKLMQKTLNAGLTVNEASRLQAAITKSERAEINRLKVETRLMLAQLKAA